MDKSKEPKFDVNGALKNIKMIISEVDGILTTDETIINELSDIPLKKFYRKDFEAINLLKRHFKVVFVSADKMVTYNLMRSKSLPFFHNHKNKAAAVKDALKRYEFRPDESIFVGCSYSDIECMKLIPLSLCPVDAVAEVHQLATLEINSWGGVGVFCELYRMLKPEINRRIKDGK